MEVNASDDRSPERLKELIHNATQNTALLAHSKPNCVILDEIDGVDGSRNALEGLINIIKAPLKAHTNSAGKAKGGSFPLTRPLICICNDQYAPALRDLIKLSDVFVFSGRHHVMFRCNFLTCDKSISVPFISFYLLSILNELFLY